MALALVEVGGVAEEESGVLEAFHTLAADHVLYFGQGTAQHCAAGWLFWDVSEVGGVFAGCRVLIEHQRIMAHQMLRKLLRQYKFPTKSTLVHLSFPQLFLLPCLFMLNVHVWFDEIRVVFDFLGAELKAFLVY